MADPRPSTSVTQMARDIEKSNLRQQIDENLRRAFLRTVEEPVPDRFAHLLSEIKAQDRETDDDRDS